MFAVKHYEIDDNTVSSISDDYRSDDDRQCADELEVVYISRQAIECMKYKISISSIEELRYFDASNRMVESNALH